MITFRPSASSFVPWSVRKVYILLSTSERKYVMMGTDSNSTRILFYPLEDSRLLIERNSQIYPWVHCPSPIEQTQIKVRVTMRHYSLRVGREVLNLPIYTASARVSNPQTQTKLFSLEVLTSRPTQPRRQISHHHITTSTVIQDGPRTVSILSFQPCTASHADILFDIASIGTVSSDPAMLPTMLHSLAQLCLEIGLTLIFSTVRSTRSA